MSCDEKLNWNKKNCVLGNLYFFNVLFMSLNYQREMLKNTKNIIMLLSLYSKHYNNIKKNKNHTTEFPSSKKNHTIFQDMKWIFIAFVLFEWCGWWESVLASHLVTVMTNEMQWVLFLHSIKYVLKQKKNNHQNGNNRTRSN